MRSLVLEWTLLALSSIPLALTACRHIATGEATPERDRAAGHCDREGVETPSVTSHEIPEAAPLETPRAHVTPEAVTRSLGLALSDVRGGAKIDAIDSTLLGGEMLDRGDIILEVDGRRVHSVDELTRYIHSLTQGTPVLLEVRRAGATRYIGIELPGAERCPTPPAPHAAASTPPAPTPSPSAIAATKPPIVVIEPAPAPAPQPLAETPGATWTTEP